MKLEDIVQKNLGVSFDEIKANSDLVKEIQQHLQNLGLYKDKIDGIWGVNTENAIASFAKSVYLNNYETKIIGANFAQKLLDTKPPIRDTHRRVNQAGLELIKSFEGLRLQAYPDPGTGGAPWTVGYGHTGRDVYPGLRISKEKAEILLKEDLARFEKAVANLVKVSLNDNQFSALVSFTYNVGEGAFGGSTLLKFLNQKEYQRAIGEFSNWVKAGGRVLPGLVRRRNAEARLFQS